MSQKRGVKQGISRGRLVLFAVVFFAINVLLLGWSGFTSDFVQWLVILGMDSFLLMSGLLMIFLWRRSATDLIKGEPLEDVPEMATVMVERLEKYARHEEREKAGL